MNSLKHIILLNLTILLLFVTCTVCEPEYRDYFCDEDFVGNYTSTSQFRKNLVVLLTTITSNTHINYGFYNLSVGQNLDVVNGVALCRGDIPTPDCKTCISHAATKITSVCPNQKSAIVWFDTCMLRYSSQSIFKGEMSQPRYNEVTGGPAPDPVRFNHTVSSLMSRLAQEAALGDSRRKFATGVANFSKTVRVYGLVQCVPDLEDYDCLNCIRLITNYTLADCCYGEVGVEAAGSTCSIRFDNRLFYQPAVVLPPLLSVVPSPSPLLSPPPPSPMIMTNEKGSRTIRVAIAITIPAVAFLMVIVIFMGCYIKRRKVSSVENQNDENDESGMVESLKLDFNIVKAATNNFSNSNKLAEGGFGTIYKGVIPSTGQVIAVKRLSNNYGQGEKEFQSEALLLAKLQHKNLVRCLGYSLAKEERLLVYEFVPNKSVDLFLFDPIKRVQLHWEKRYSIIGGIARGLLYLHEESRLLVVHRDLKASNVLLDAEMNPKISDFGMARLFSADQSHANTCNIAGTDGYMPPEYVVHGHFSIKTDVFSFGVLVLEIVSGHKVSEARNGESLLSFAWRNWSEGKALNIVDSTVSDVNTTEVLRCVHIGLLCVQENAARRPIMSSVVLMLNSHSVTLPIPSRPAFLVQNDMDSTALHGEPQ
ncbi:cysteine-rich receptor-like protein kinase 15 isoform X2 [Silene latifolia]|uniref:cysteine-rich receptor-like protein kinase 15 isoform X2 n=1 Tax=Silene latifolia TaxID=37657 RepID=UPI003D774F35